MESSSLEKIEYSFLEKAEFQPNTNVSYFTKMCGLNKFNQNSYICINEKGNIKLKKTKGKKETVELKTHESIKILSVVSQLLLNRSSETINAEKNIKKKAEALKDIIQKKIANYNKIKISKKKEEIISTLFPNLKEKEIDLISKKKYQVSVEILTFINQYLYPILYKKEMEEKKADWSAELVQQKSRTTISSGIKTDLSVVNGIGGDLYRYLFNPGGVQILDENQEDVLRNFKLGKNFKSKDPKHFFELVDFIVRYFLEKLGCTEDLEDEKRLDQDAFVIANKLKELILPDGEEMDVANQQVQFDRFYDLLFSGELGGEKGKKLACLLRGFCQTLGTTPSLVINHLVGGLEIENCLSIPKFKKERDSFIQFKFSSDNQVTISHQHKWIEKDHPMPPVETIKEDYETTYQIEVEMKNQLISKLSDLQNWSSTISFGLAKGKINKEQEQQILTSIDIMKQILKEASYEVFDYQSTHPTVFMNL